MDVDFHDEDGVTVCPKDYGWYVVVYDDKQFARVTRSFYRENGATFDDALQWGLNEWSTHAQATIR